MKKKNPTRAVAFQIVGTFLVVISAFLLIAYVFIDKVKADILQAKEGGKEYTVIAARKVPEYTQLASEQGAYQAVYEVGIRGGYNNRSVGRVDHINVSYGTVNISTAIWMDEVVRKNIPTTPPPNIILQIPEDKTIEGNLTEVIRNATLAYLRIRAPESGMDIGPYENATFMINRSECISEEYTGMGKGCFNITIIPTSYTQKNYTSSGSLISATTVTSTINTHREIRLFKMYELMRSFIKNNFLVRAGEDPLLSSKYNLLAKQLEANDIGETATCAGDDCDWDKKTRTSAFYPSGSTCDLSGTGSGNNQNALLNYSCVEKLVAPACEYKIQNKLITKIKELETDINTKDDDSSYSIFCPPGYPNCEPVYGVSRIPLNKDASTSNYFANERFRWKIRPPENKSWGETIRWEGGQNDDYNVLWWSQNTTGTGIGQCTLPQGHTYLTDTQPDITGANNFGKNTWTKDTGFPSYAPNFPEGTGCADAYYVSCHEVWKFLDPVSTVTSSCGGTCSTQAWKYCEREDINGAGTDISHTSGGLGPAEGLWCKDDTTSYDCTTVPSCCSTCCSSWNPPCCSNCDTSCSCTDTARNSYQFAYYTHCDIRYDFYGHFRYRARIDPLILWLVDESKVIPVQNSSGEGTLVKPTLVTTYKGVVYEEPDEGDRCLENESGEGVPDDTYYHSGDVGSNECPKKRNENAERSDYYTSASCTTCSGFSYCDLANRRYCNNGPFGAPDDTNYCLNCGYCGDNVQNCGETGVDCGGTCTPC